MTKMRARLCVAPIIVAILCIRNANPRIVEGTPERASLDDDLAIDWAGLEDELDSSFNANYEYANLREYDNKDVEFEDNRKSDEDGIVELEYDIDREEDSEIEINFNALKDEDDVLNDDDDEDIDPCLSEPDLPECTVVGNEDAINL